MDNNQANAAGRHATYMLICDSCGQKHFTDGSDVSDLTELKTAPPPKRANGVDKTTAELPKKFKCYNCGMLFRIIQTGENKPAGPVIVQDEPDYGDDYLKRWEKECLKSARTK